MEKKLFIQIHNEWQGNLWLALELLVVSVVMWYIIDMLYCQAATYNEPRGFNIEHCYLIKMGVLTEKSPEFKPYSDATEQQTAEVRELAERLRHRPEIEAVSLSVGAYPYNGSNSTEEVTYDTLKSPLWTICRLATPDFVRVFQYRGAQGETSEQLAEKLQQGDFLASNNLFRKYQIPMTALVGKKGFHLFGDTLNTYRLGAALQNVRHDDYTQGYISHSIVYNLDRANLFSPGIITAENELCVRVRADKDKNFIANLKADSEKQYRIGNIYISDIHSFQDIRKNFQQSNANQMRNYFIGMGFLLLNIFLGLLGTFWFRTQQRRSEIALHKAMGASNQAIFSRLMCEGLFILLIVSVPAILIDYNLAYLELNSWRNGTTLEWDRILSCSILTCVLIALMIVIGISIPAYRAMKIQPAEALHDE